MPTISNRWNMTCRQQVEYWSDAKHGAHDEAERRNAAELERMWIDLELKFGPDHVVADLTVIDKH